MSAIWGIIDFFHPCGTDELFERMKKPYDNYKLDTYGKYVNCNMVFGYGGQYFTKEAQLEKQPITGEDHRIIFAADVVLDNRSDLFKLLEINEKNEQDSIPDGSLMYLVIRKFGRESFNLFLGTYAFVYYDRDIDEVVLVSDSVGSRSLYYCYENGKVYFSTLMKSIQAVRGQETEWNDRFFADYLSMNNLGLYTDVEETLFQGLFKVTPGQAVIISRQGVKKEDYWKPLCTELTGRSDADIKEEFIRLFDTCVSSVMRSSDRTGILLSGGLDSTSVACFAAPKLKKEDKQLYTYTSIPERDYVSKQDPYYNTNEQKHVECTKNFLGNLFCTFLELPGVNGFDGAEHIMELYEVPSKSLQNIKWMHEAAVSAAKDGCRILLNGQYGNATISLGDFDIHFHTLLKKGYFVTLTKEVRAMCKRYYLGRKMVYKDILSNIKSLLMVKMFKQDVLENVYVNPELAKQYDVSRRLNKIIKKEGVMVMDFPTFRSYMFNKKALVQIGEAETHLSLATGVLVRDPSKDRRIIEFCIRLPENQFVHNGIERRLIREYLVDYLPKEILMDYRHRGLQSADAIERLNKNWKNIYQECISLLESEEAKKLLDVPKIRLKLESYKDQLPSNAGFEAVKLLYSILLVKFVTINSKENSYNDVTNIANTA